MVAGTYSIIMHCGHYYRKYSIYKMISTKVILGVVVQWLDYLAVTQEPGVRFPATAEKCHLMWRCPSGHGINYA